MQLEGAQRRHARDHLARAGRAGAQPRVPRQRRLDQPVRGPVRHGVGIMISFRGLANVKEATIATVAPGISEALVATAMGLFAAIPAVWAYNRYATRAERIAVRYDTFGEEFASILQRQARGRLRRAWPPPPRRHRVSASSGRHQRRPLHRRDAGAADHLHGHRAAAQRRRRRQPPAVRCQAAGTEQSSRWSCRCNATAPCSSPTRAGPPAAGGPGRPGGSAASCRPIRSCPCTSPATGDASYQTVYEVLTLLQRDAKVSRAG